MQQVAKAIFNVLPSDLDFTCVASVEKYEKISMAHLSCEYLMLTKSFITFNFRSDIPFSEQFDMHGKYYNCIIRNVFANALAKALNYHEDMDLESLTVAFGGKVDSTDRSIVNFTIKLS